MTDRTEKKLQDVVVARYQYRHEAEFAAGFLDDAGIPYRLQVDDPGLGMTISAPATLWVRGMDLQAALEVLDLKEPMTTIELEVSTPSEHERAAARQVVGPVRQAVRRSGRLTGLERAVSGVIAVGFAASAAWLIPSPWADPWGRVLLGAAAVFGVSALVGRTIPPIRGLLSTISGSTP